MPVASLPMYDLPEASGGTDGWWQGLAAGASPAPGVADVPDRLVRGASAARHLAWRPTFCSAQTCGYPLTDALAGRVELARDPVLRRGRVRTGPDYCSVVIVGADSTASASRRSARQHAAPSTVLDSQSGYNVLRALLAPLAQGRRFCRTVAISGGHRASLAMVATGAADFAAIDCVTWAMLARAIGPPRSPACGTLLRTPRSPGLPYITAGAPTPIVGAG